MVEYNISIDIIVALWLDVTYALKVIILCVQTLQITRARGNKALVSIWWPCSVWSEVPAHSHRQNTNLHPIGIHIGQQYVQECLS